MRTSAKSGRPAIAWVVGLVGLAVAACASAHVDSADLTDACGSCHVGHGEKGEPMLARSEEAFCYQCHGSAEERSAMVAAGKLRPGADLVDLRVAFDMPNAHPVKRSGEHSPTETLPEFAGSTVSHAKCVDCHNPHERIRGGGGPGYKVSGYSLSGRYLEQATFEYEICLKCHADHAGTKTADRSLSKAFDRTARSQHPVTSATTGGNSPSLRDKSSQGSYMKCSDCHWSGDEEHGRGPHGSRHESMLSGNYDRSLYVTESPYAFEFCYSCHDRQSILANESFPLHREHVEGDLAKGIRGTSCYTCHDAHGSEYNTHLIRFDPLAVSAAKSGRPANFSDEGDRQGTCVLECHGYNHEPGSYR